MTGIVTFGPRRRALPPPILDLVFDLATMSLFYALLAVAAELAVGGAVVLAVAGLALAPARRLLGAVRDDVTGLGVPFAFVVATVAMTGSLYFSEVAHFNPCRLCWWQRGFMYPLVPLLLAAWLLPAWRLWRVALPMAVVGAGIATYHSAITRWPSLEVGKCSLDNPCTLKWVEKFGYVTIPVMSLSAFLLIITLLLVDRRPS